MKTVDTFPYPHDMAYEQTVGKMFQFYSHDGTVLGYMLPLVALELSKHPETVTVNYAAQTVTISATLASIEARDVAFDKIARCWKNAGSFETLEGWRDEQYVVYHPLSVPYLRVERAFSVLIGVVTYGVHINGYVPKEHSTTGKTQMWIARRSTTKPTFPGMLDNTIAGGIGYPQTVNETVIKEAMEEASLPEEYVTEHVRSAGVLSYMYQHDPTSMKEAGLIQPEVQFIYDLPFIGVVPGVNDDEVGGFELMDIADVKQAMLCGEFKPNCAMVMLDFLIRHGFLRAGTAVDEDPEVEYIEVSEFLDIQSRCHRRIPFPTM
ncbi:hypothetical protein BABINDRAFT_170034 [Babjeviella inositovora NRRL Y-12698]|uniref:Nudix hydrolase domain-containing protein n=1 Tax=Babjeviella inositovora NRRL Y-12698 TaxID=984486 RepID=A0A1E3QZ50_9ASCO|nr:uncharacterized protein BABINDRAFT_170034 [Babjeviella inositovora NRRL Y-12698]ODQ82918.1 hypothetical protein BABINDRAFT_170034 [Babjeviella inositovora NRRL Y-12698]